MTISITNRPPPSWLRELGRGRAAYEELLGWPVAVRVGDRALVVSIGETLDAVTMPAALGTRVSAALSIAMLSAPVATDPDGARWTFVTKPLDRLRPTIEADLSHLGVTVAPHGSHVVVPTHPDVTAGRSWRWVEPPVAGRSLPPAYAVIGVTRRLADQDGHRLAA